MVVAAVAYLLYQAYQSAKLETSESRTIKHLPPSVQQVVASMDPQTQNTFFNEYLKKRKRKSVGWILQQIPITWHYLYAGNVGLQFACLVHRRWLRHLVADPPVPDAQHHPRRQRAHRSASQYRRSGRWRLSGVVRVQTSFPLPGRQYDGL